MANGAATGPAGKIIGIVELPENVTLKWQNNATSVQLGRLYSVWCILFVVLLNVYSIYLHQFFFSHNSFIQGYGMTNCTPMSGRARGNGLMARGGANASFKVAGSTGALAMLRKHEFMHVGNMYACWLERKCKKANNGSLLLIIFELRIDGSSEDCNMLM